MNLKKNFFCEVCNKNRGKHFDHSECSKILQQTKIANKSKKPKVLTNKQINSFLKFIGQ